VSGITIKALLPTAHIENAAEFSKTAEPEPASLFHCGDRLSVCP